MPDLDMVRVLLGALGVVALLLWIAHEDERELAGGTREASPDVCGHRCPPGALVCDGSVFHDVAVPAQPGTLEVPACTDADAHPDSDRVPCADPDTHHGADRVA